MTSAIRGKSDGAGESLRGALVSAAVGRIHGSGNEQSELGSVAAVERQFRDALLLDDLFEGRRSRVDLHGIARYRDDFGRHAQLQAEVDGERLIRKQYDPGFLGGAEPVGFDRQVVCSGLKRGNDKEPFRIRKCRAGEPGAHLESSHFSIRDGSASGVCYSPGNATETLRMRRNRNEQECEKNEQDMLLHFSLPFRGVPERESGPARRTTIECGGP